MPTVESHIALEDVPELEKTATALQRLLEADQGTRDQLRTRLGQIDGELAAIDKKRGDQAEALAGGDLKAGTRLEQLDAEHIRKQHEKRGLTANLAKIHEAITAKEATHSVHRQQLAHAGRRLQGMEIQSRAYARLKDFTDARNAACQKLGLVCVDLDALDKLGPPFNSMAGRLMEDVVDAAFLGHLENQGWTRTGVLPGYAWQFQIRPLLPPAKG